MKGIVHTDTSYFQVALDTTYPHHWVSFRACDGTFRDPKFAQNLAVAKHMVKTGALEGYDVYAVYRPGIDIVSVVKDMVGEPDHRIVVKLDIESWGGQIRGDHQAEITAIADRFAQWLGSHKRVLVYGNLGDLDALDAHRPGWLRSVVAGYSAEQPTARHMIGWQYSDGSPRWARPRSGLRRLPRKSKPFGACDHNVFLGVQRKDVAALFALDEPKAAPVAPRHSAAPVKPTPTPKPKPSPGTVDHDKQFENAIGELDGAPAHLSYEKFVDDIADAIKSKLGG